MKKIVVLFMAIPIIAFSQDGTLTLAQARSIVLSDNPSVQEALERINSAEAVVKQARSAYLPTITLKGTYGVVDASLHPDAYPSTRTSDSFLQGTIGLQGSWLLFDGFSRRAQNLAANYSAEKAEEMADETRRLLILSTTVAFRQAQLAEQKLEIAKQDYDFNMNLKEDAQKRFDAGATPKADVDTFSIRALQAESSMLQAQLDHQTACTVLAQLMALPDAKLPAKFRPISIVFEDQEKIPELDEEYEFALKNRPDYKALLAGRNALAQQVRATKGDMLPKIALIGEVNYKELGDGYSYYGNFGNYNSFAGVSASWDLFSGGRKKSAIDKAKAEMRAVDDKIESLRLSMRSSLRQRIDEAKTSMAISDRQKEIYQLSESVRESVEKSYKAGAESITRLNEAQTNLVKARGAYVSSYISYMLVLNQLDIETGRVLEQLY